MRLLASSASQGLTGQAIRETDLSVKQLTQKITHMKMVANSSGA